jgi:RNA polymerase sigma factor (sigma-70 family)
MERANPIMAERSTSLAQLVKDESARLWRFIRGRVASNADADDVLQDVMAQLAGVSGPLEPAAGWLYTVAKNRIIDRRRRKTLPIDDGDLELGIEGWLADDRGTPEDDYLRSLLWDELARGLAALPKEQRQVFVWHELDGLSFKEMSERTGDKVATLISRKRYAVLALRERLAELYEIL